MWARFSSVIGPSAIEEVHLIHIVWHVDLTVRQSATRRVYWQSSTFSINLSIKSISIDEVNRVGLMLANHDGVKTGWLDVLHTIN